MYQTEKVREFSKEIKQVTKGPTRFGMFLFIVVFIGVGGWASTAQLEKAAIASGEIIVSGNNKVVQHLEGGIIEKLNVKEGDEVKEGDILISLSKTAAGSSAQIVEDALTAFYAEYYRLTAERDGHDKVNYPAEWLQPENAPKYKAYIDSQNRIFDEHLRAYHGKVDILEERTNQMGSQISGLRAQISSARDQLMYVNREIAQVEKLLSQGNTTMSRLLDLRTRKSDIDGRLGELNSEISKTQQAISENKLSIINIKNENLNDVAEKIKEVQAKINEFKERGTATTDTLKRTDIIAPISGKVKDIKFKTIGGIIKPGEDILTIVPQNSLLIAEVKISPKDIDVIAVGQKARIKLMSYSARHVGNIDGELTDISADVFKDERSQQTYYTGKVKIDLESAKQFIHKDISQILVPGMPVEVFIASGSHTPLKYLFEPVTRTFQRSMREE